MVKPYERPEMMKQHCHEIAACYSRIATTGDVATATHIEVMFQGLGVVHPSLSYKTIHEFYTMPLTVLDSYYSIAIQPALYAY